MHLSTHALVGETTVEESIETFGAPRRLVAIARNIRVKQEDVSREVIGPPKSVAFDVAGQPTRAAFSFAEKQGVPVSKLAIVNTPKGEYVAVKQVILGKAATEILAGILPEVIREISWPRSMYWTGLQSPRFIRPIRWIVALLDGKIIPFSLAGVRPETTPRGIAFLARREFAVTGSADYESKLQEKLCPVPAGGAPQEN